jgi:hypothetical protein
MTGKIKVLRDNPLLSLRRITHGRRVHRTQASTITRLNPSVLSVAILGPFIYTVVESRLCDLNGRMGGLITECRRMRKLGRNERKVNGSKLQVQILFINNHSAIPLAQYNTEP